MNNPLEDLLFLSSSSSSSSSTSFIKAKLEDHDTAYLLSTERAVQIPTSASDCRQLILNSLQTITPNLIMFKPASLGSLKNGNENEEQYNKYFILYDWYYCDSKLNMLLLGLDSFELYDAFVFREDYLHILKSNKVYKHIEQVSSFAGFYIRTKHNSWMSLNKALCCSMKISKSNPALLSWYADAVLFSECTTFQPPTYWKPFPIQFVNVLHFSPALPNLNQKQECEHVNCLCKQGNVSPIIPSTCNPIVKAYISDAVKHLQHCSSLMKTNIYAHSNANISHSSNTIISLDSKGNRMKCWYDPQCTYPVICYWVSCCKYFEPVACQYHAQEAFKQNANDMQCRLSSCPKHHISGKFACLLV